MNKVEGQMKDKAVISNFGGGGDFPPITVLPLARLQQ